MIKRVRGRDEAVRRSAGLPVLCGHAKRRQCVNAGSLSFEARPKYKKHAASCTFGPSVRPVYRQSKELALPGILPSRFQPPLPQDKLILSEPPSAEALEMDVLFVGAGPAGLAGAIELARLAKKDPSAGELN